MANKHYEHALKGLPCRVSTTALMIYQIICYRYDLREIKDGKPNRGYLKSYPGMATFVKATGRSRQACNTAIESLIANGVIIRIAIGKPGSQAEYVPIHTLNALEESVKYSLHVAKVYKTRKLADNVKNTGTMSKEDLLNESSLLNTISTISNHKYDKYDQYNKERFDKLITYLSEDLRQYVKPGKNYEERLDELERRGTNVEAVGVFLSKQNFATSHKIGGLISSFLDELLGVKPKGVSSSMPKWCGRDFCDQATRLFPEVSEDNFGRLTNKCLKCHPDYVK